MTASFDLDNVIPGIPARDHDQVMSGLTPIVSFDSRDNLFTPTRGFGPGEPIIYFQFGSAWCRP